MFALASIEVVCLPGTTVCGSNDALCPKPTIVNPKMATPTPNQTREHDGHEGTSVVAGLASTTRHACHVSRGTTSLKSREIGMSPQDYAHPGTVSNRTSVHALPFSLTEL